MKKVVMCFFLLASFTIMPGFAELTKAQLQGMYLDFLTAKNIKAEADENGDILFVHNLQDYEFRYRIRVDPDDPEFFQLFTSDLWRLESEEELADAFFAVNGVNRNVWLAKASVNSRSDGIIFTVQTLLVKPEDFINVFDKLVECLDEGFLTFAYRMRG
jgi:hypothetical protein